MTQCCQIKGLYRPIIEMSSRCMYLFSRVIFFPPTYFVAFSSARYCDWNELGACALWCFTQDVQFQPGELALNHYNTLASPRAFHSLRGRGAGPPACTSGDAPRCGGAAPPAYTSRHDPGQGPPVAAMTRGARPAAEAARARWRPRPSGGEGERRGGAAGGASCQGPLPTRCPGSAEGRPVAAASRSGAGLLRAELLLCCRRDGLGSASPEELRDRGRSGRGEGGGAALVRVPGGLELTMPGVWGGTLIRKVSGARRSGALQGGLGPLCWKGGKVTSFVSDIWIIYNCGKLKKSFFKRRFSP